MGLTRTFSRAVVSAALLVLLSSDLHNLFSAQKTSPLELDYFESVDAKNDVFPAYAVWISENFLSLQALIDFAKEDLDQLLSLSDNEVVQLAGIAKRAQEELQQKQRDPQILSLNRMQSNQLFAELTKNYRKEIEESLLPHQREFTEEIRRLNRLRALGVATSLTMLSENESLELTPRRLSELRSGLGEKLKRLQAEKHKLLNEAIARLVAPRSENEKSNKPDASDGSKARRAISKLAYSPALEIAILQTKSDSKMIKPSDDPFANLRFNYQFDLWGSLSLHESAQTFAREYIVSEALSNRDLGYNEAQHMEVTQTRASPDSKWGKRKAEFQAELNKQRERWQAGELTWEAYLKAGDESILKLEKELWQLDQSVLLPHQLEHAQLAVLGMELQLHGPFHFAKTYSLSNESAVQVEIIQVDLRTKLSKLQVNFHREISEYLAKELSSKQREAFEHAFGKIAPERKHHFIGELHFSPRDFVIPGFEKYMSQSEFR